MATVQIADERAFSFLRVNERQPKPRTEGITEIRGPYYTPMGTRCLEDILDTMGNYVDFTEVRRRVLHADAASCGCENH